MNEDTKHIVAAIFTAGLCQGKQTEAADYFKIYDQCLGMIRERNEAEKGSKEITITDQTLAKSRAKPQR